MVSNTVKSQRKIVFDPYSDIGLAVGRKLSGKSYALKKLMQPIQRLIVWDYNHEHTDKITVHNIEDLKVYWHTFVGQNRKRIAFQPMRRTPEAFEAFIKCVLGFRYVCVVIEEIRIYTMQGKTPPALSELIDTGRHIHIGVWCTSRRAKGVTVDIPYNADHILAFKQYKPEDIKYLSEYMDSEAIEELKSKPNYWFVYFDGKTGETTLHAPL